MQIPYCVVDAATLIENIHEIKKWIYNGQIRLVVPVSTLERVEQLYQKSIAQKPKSQEPTRPKSSGKTVRKEYPNFDINARLAKAFLAWLQRDKDSWDPELRFAVEFQQAGEVYTPWKLAEERGEQRDASPEKGPTTFAQAVAKSNLAKQISETGDAIKGPVKPKLVARAPGSDKLPWNIGRKVPQIPLRELPVEVRPVLSYVLWRLHESNKGRADAISLIVLSENLKMHSAGQKLDVVIKRIDSIRHDIAVQEDKDRRDTMGDLEREFGVREPRPRVSQNGSVQVDGNDGICSNEIQAMPVVEDGTKNGCPMGVEALNQTLNGKGEEKSQEKEVKTEEPLENGLDGTTVVDKPTNGSALPAADLDIESHDLSKQTYPTIIEIAEENEAQPKTGFLASDVSGSNAFASEKISNITAWIKNLAPKLSPNAKPDLDSRQEKNNFAKHEDGPRQVSVPIIQPVVLQRPVEFSTPSPRQTSTASSAPASAVDEREDSNEEFEEVIVFKPNAKRLSAQKKPPHQSPKQIIAQNTTQNVAQDIAQNSAQNAVQKAPQPRNVPQNAAQTVVHTTASNVARNPNPKASQSPKQTVHRSSRNAIPVRHPRNKTPPVAPAIIDPDAFGRTFATNPKASVHNNHPESRYSPRGSPRRAIMTPEPELDYILKSGNTRASGRGRGKLWVP